MRHGQVEHHDASLWHGDATARVPSAARQRRRVRKQPHPRPRRQRPPGPGRTASRSGPSSPPDLAVSRAARPPGRSVSGIRRGLPPSAEIPRRRAGLRLAVCLSRRAHQCRSPRSSRAPSPLARNRNPARPPFSRRRFGYFTAGQLSYVPPFLRHTSPRRGIRYPYHPGAPGTSRREDGHDLHTCPEPRRPRSAQPCRPFVVSRRCCGSSRLYSSLFAV